MAQKKTEIHVDDWIREFSTDPAVQYAKWFLFLKRLPAIHQVAFADYIGKYELFAVWKGTRYRVTGASRLGDVWLGDYSRVVGYDRRVSINELSDWRPKP